MDELREILRLHPELNSKQLKLMLPKDVTAWRGKDMSTLLISILQHKHVDASISRAVVNCALAVVQPGMLFWEVIPEKMTKLDLSRNNLGSKLDDELRHILAALQSVVELDLSENNLSSKDSAILAKIFATMSSSVRRLDLSANNLDRKSMARIIHLMPAGVADIAIDQHKFMPRAVVKAQCTNYSFVLKCLAGIAMVTGAAMLIVGLLYLQPVLVQAGIGLMATVAVSVCLAGCGLFSTKDLKKTDKLEVVDAPHHSMF